MAEPGDLAARLAADLVAALDGDPNFKRHGELETSPWGSGQWVAYTDPEGGRTTCGSWSSRAGRADAHVYAGQMDTWEERMAAKAELRAAAAKAAKPDPRAGHEGHHTHLSGTCVYCSCGEFQGVTCVAFIPGDDPREWSCDVCGARGVARLG